MCPLPASQFHLALQRFASEVGPAETLRTSPGGARAASFLLNPEGEGALCVRVARPDAANVHDALMDLGLMADYCIGRNLFPREAIVGFARGNARRADRPDLDLVEEGVRAGALPWVAWPRPEHISRRELGSHAHLDFLHATGARLHLMSLGREVSLRRVRPGGREPAAAARSVARGIPSPRMSPLYGGDNRLPQSPHA